MAHSIVYGICENKCQVEVMSKEDILNMRINLMSIIDGNAEMCRRLQQQINNLQEQVDKLKR